MQKIKKRREEVSSLLLRGYRENEIAVKLNISIRTVARDIAFFKTTSVSWLEGLAKDGFTFEYRLALDKLKEIGLEYRALYDETKDPWQKIALLKALEQNAKLYLEMLGEYPTIHALRKALKIKPNVSQA